MTMFTEDEEISPPFKQYPNFSFSDEFFEFVSPLEDDNSPHSTPLFCSGYGLSEYNNQEENSSNNSFEEILIFQEHIVSSEAFQNIFEQLPTELLMEIFLHIFPDKQIFRNLTLVCKYWKAILDSEHFWKKANKTWLGGPKKGLLEKKKSWKEFVLSSASHWTHCQMQEELVEKFQSLKRNAAIGNYVSWFWSCEKGHIELVKRLLYGDKGYIYLNARDKRGRTALYHASRNGHHHIVDLLLSHFPIKNSKNDINNFNNEEENDENINQAIVESNDENKKLMIEINCKLCDGTTPLLSACQHGHYKVVKILLKYNADVNESRNSGASPLYLASQEGHAKVVKLLLKSNAEVDTVRKVGATPLYIAAQNGHLNVVDLLIKASANVDKKRNSGTTPLHVACHEGNIEVVKRLLLANADVNNPRESGQTCLFIACYHGNLQLVSLLLQHKPNVNTQPSPLVVACQRGEYKIVKLLLKAGADPNLLSNNVTPLIIACQFSMPKIVSLLLKYNSNPNVTRLYDNLTPLSIACQLNALPIVKKLIYAGADPNFAPNGELPLHIAIFNSSFSIVKFLLSKPDNSIRILNNEAENIDNIAISSIEMNEKQKVRRERLTANVNSTSAAENSKFAIFGESAIHIASRFGNLKMIKLLIKRGANINALRPNGDNAEVIAKKSNNKEIASYLHQMRHQNKIENHQSFSSMVVKLHRMLSNF